MTTYIFELALVTAFLADGALFFDLWNGSRLERRNRPLGLSERVCFCECLYSGLSATGRPRLARQKATIGARLPPRLVRTDLGFGTLHAAALLIQHGNTRCLTFLKLALNCSRPRWLEETIKAFEQSPRIGDVIKYLVVPVEPSQCLRSVA